MVSLDVTYVNFSSIKNLLCMELTIFFFNRNDLKELKDPNFHFEEKSILDNNIYDFVQDRIDIVIHLAAQTSVFKSLENPDLNNLININGFENIFSTNQKTWC